MTVVHDSHTGKRYVCKTISRSKVLLSNSLDKFEREVRVSQLLRHEGVVTVKDVIYDDECVHLITDYYPMGDLFQYIVDHGRISEEMTKRMFVKILDALSYIHSHDVAHRDIKPENILLDSQLNPKITDFGLCHNTDHRMQLRTPCGTPFYAAPELLETELYDGKKADIWSLGVVLYTMTVGQLPWTSLNQNELYSQIMSGEYSFPPFLSLPLMDLIQRMMALNPSERPDTTEILKHKWLRDMRKNDEYHEYSYKKVQVQTPRRFHQNTTKQNLVIRPPNCSSIWKESYRAIPPKTKERRSTVF